MKRNSMYFFYLVFLMILQSCVNSQQEKSETKSMTKNHLYEESQSLDETLDVKSDAIIKLKELLQKEKFGPEEKTDQLPLGYVGFLPEEDRPLANKTLNESIVRLISILKQNNKVTSRIILDEFEIGLNSFEDLAFDTEDGERVCWYYEDIMDIIGLESTYELLNNWMY